MTQEVEAVYGKRPDVDDDLFALGGSSLQAIDLMTRFEALLGASIDVERLIMANSIPALIDELASDLESRADKES